MKSDTNKMCRAIIIFDDNTTLVQWFPEYGTYLTVGGHIKKGESLWDGFKREVFEETGLKIIGEERKPNFKHGNNYYYILQDGDIDGKSKGFITHDDEGEVKVVTMNEYFDKNNPHKDTDKIKPDLLAINSTINKFS